MFSWKPFLQFLHRFAALWLSLECFLTCPWRKPGKATKSDPSLFSTRSPVPSPQQSFEKASLENGNISSENFVSHSSAVFMTDGRDLGNGIVFGKASVQREERPINPFQGGCGDDPKPSALAHHFSTPASRDLSESRRDLVLEDDAVFGVLASLSSDSNDTIYGADTSDEFLSAVGSAHDISIGEPSPCWMKAAEAEWRSGVTAAMDAFRACKDTDDEPIFMFSKDSKRHSFGTIALHPNQRIREIQNWRNYLGGDGDTSLSSEGGYGVDTTFQYP